MINKLIREQKDILLIIVLIVITGLVVGFGVYWWQQSLVRELRGELTQKRSELSQFNKDKDPERYLELVSPNGGEILCKGEEFIIQWKNKGIKTIALGIKTGTDSYGLPNAYGLPADYNETGESGSGMFVWKVDKVGGNVDLKEGHIYSICIYSFDEDYEFEDCSDDLFSILECKG